MTRRTAVITPLIAATKKRSGRKPGATSRLKSNNSSKNTLTRLRLTLTLLLTVLFILALIWLNKVETQTQQRTNPNSGEVAKPLTDTDTYTNPDNSEDYTFYSKLKDFKVRVPADTAYDKQADADDNAVFIIQAGSFKTPEQAEQRLVELKLLGLEPEVSSAVNASGNLWYRVRIGPFTSRSELSSARNKIISNGIEAMIMKRQPQ